MTTRAEEVWDAAAQAVAVSVDRQWVEQLTPRCHARNCKQCALSSPADFESLVTGIVNAAGDHLAALNPYRGVVGGRAMDEEDLR